jgi:hypothetical protein
VFRLAPFLGSSKLASLVQDFEENLALEQLRQLSAYLPPEMCSRIFMRLLNEPGDYRFEELAPFAPFIDDEALVALVRAVPPPDLQALKRIAPFLEEEEVGRLLRGLLKGESDHR